MHYDKEIALSLQKIPLRSLMSLLLIIPIPLKCGSFLRSFFYLIAFYLFQSFFSCWVINPLTGEDELILMKIPSYCERHGPFCCENGIPTDICRKFARNKYLFVTHVLGFDLCNE